MALLLTGATGHVGAGIVKAAAAREIATVAIYRGKAPPADTDLSCIKWVRCDLGDAAAVDELVKTHQIDACIHAAAVMNEAYARPDPAGAITANVGTTANLLEAARTQNWRRFLLVSTGSVFQKRAVTGLPIAEDAEPEPENVYSTTKAAAEMLCRMYRTEYGLSASAVRLSWVYGPPIATQDAARGPIPSLLIRALSGEEICEGGADFATSFTFVADVANGMLAAVAARELSSAIYHLGHGVNFTLGEVADAIRQAVPGAVIELAPGTEPWTRFTAMRDPLAGSRLIGDTGFKPEYSLSKGIAEYADWLRAGAG